MGNESDARESFCGLTERRHAGSVCWKQQSLRRARVRRWRPVRGFPAGLTLAPEAARATAFLHVLLPLQPQMDGAWSQAMLRKALGAGRARKPRLEPRSWGESPDPEVRAPLEPLGGELTLSGRSDARSLRVGRPTSPLGAAGGVYGVRFAPEPSAFPAARQGLCASAMGLLRSLSTDETNNNNDRYYKTK